MKKFALKLKSSRRIVNLITFSLLFGGALFAWQTVAELQTETDEIKPESKEKAVSIHAAGRGNPFVNFTDGADLPSSNDAKNNDSQPQTLASADFDADGIEDLVTADAGGNLKFYRGNFLRSGDVEKGRLGDGETRRKGEIEPFKFSGKSFALSISPDFLLTGDFNADGQKDVLAAAKAGNFVVFLSGDGRGNFSQSNALPVAGQITAMQTGEIGRKDGQTDVAVAFTNKSGAFLAVFEHPEGAFKHKPEIFKLPAPATDLAIGNLDEDFYADIAVASGDILTIVHGRGQAYPWDLLPDSGIKRPSAFVASRKMPFAISALTTGRFGTKRGDSLAMLGQDGNVYQIESNGSEKSSKNIISAENYNAAPNPFVPSADDALNSAVISAPQLSREDAEKFGLLNDRTVQKNGEISDAQRKLLEEQFENFKKTDQKDIDSKRAENAAKSIEDREKAKDAFLKSIAGKPSTLANWNLKTLISNSQFSGAAASGNSRKILRVNVSDSNMDDILLIDSTVNQLQIVSQVKETPSKNQTSAQVTTLETEGSPLAALPMRLNMDALTDLVVLREGASVPSVVMTAPTETLTVNSTDDTGDCQPGNPCSLRNAILYANSHSGVETIYVRFGGAATITPSQELPKITNAVNILGDVSVNGLPDVEISGANVPAPANGLLIRTSNTFIFGLAINGFKSTISGQSQLGGNGIAIDSLSGSPVNGNNVILLTFLGTDRTGSFDKGNDAAGLNIFTSDNNQIIQNVMSGNGSQQKSGAGIAVTAGNSNLLINNIIGLNSLGTGKVANTTGVFLTGSNNTFGGDGAGDGNTVSGNGEPYFNVPSQCGGDGLAIPVLVDVQTHELLTFGNIISGNRFGTNPAGSVGLGNCYRGIDTEPITGTVIGSITENGRNTVSGNGYDAIWCGSPYSNETSGFGFCAIVGNNIGTDISGTIPIRNDQRNIRDGANPVTGAVFMTGNGSLSNIGAPGGTTPNGECTGFCNLISGNDNSPSFDSAAGVQVGGVGVIGIFNNYIGTNKNGTQAISNSSAVNVASTIYTNFSPTYLLGTYGTQDGNPVSFGNLISGNSGGVSIGVGGNTVGNYLVLGNKIGTDASGTFAVPNVGYFGLGGSGITVNTGFGYGTTQIGDANPLGRNIISGNGFDGIFLFTGYNVNIANNLIGVNSSLAPLGNGGNGIELGGFFGVGNIIGGGSSNAVNIIQNNTKAGILVKGVDYFANNLRGNSISNNGGLGIDLKAIGGFGDGDGVTPNDCQDADSGANGVQNFPLLDAPVINGNGTVKLTGALLSRPFNSYAIDFYSNPAADSSNHGEGAIYIGSLNVNTDDHGLAAIDFTSANSVNTSNVFSATATDIFGNTSEFSCNAGATCSDSFAFKNNDSDSLANDDSLTSKEKYERLALACFFNEIVVNVITDEADTPTNLNNNICDVDTATSGDQCTLRAAIQVAEHRAGFDNIRFAIPGAGVQTISPQNQLPQITTFLTIDGTSQPGYSNTPLIKLDGYYFPDSIGLQLNGGGAVVKGLSIVGFNRGISLNGRTNNKIIGCHIGINADGMTAPTERQDIGIDITNGSSQNQIGGVNPTDRNIISNNITGIHFFGGTNNKIINNIIGGNISQTGKLPNNNGIVLEGSNNNEIGVDNSAPNYIFGNNGGGIVIDNNSSGNKISGNRIGVTATGNFDLGNLNDGIVVTNGSNRNTIGGDTAEKGNIIGGHVSLDNSTGVLFNSTAGVNNRVLFNHIGTVGDGDGIFIAPNQFGVVVRSSSQIIGRVATPNVIGGNMRSGIFVDGRTANVKETIIEGNLIGTDGTHNLGNERNGIATEGDVTYSKIDRNVISGNSENGILIGDGRFNTIICNKIGTNADGNDHINNNKNGIFIRGGGNIVGGTNFSDGNVISGNALNGIYIETGSNANKIYGNLIGTTNDGANPLGNAENGIMLFGTKTEIIGNTVSSNTKIGIRIERGTSDAAQQDNMIQSNFIGTTSDGESPIGNLSGVLLISGASNNIISDNVISGNTDNGVSIRRGSTANLIFANHIGTNTDGSNGIGNGLNGVTIEGSNNTVNSNIISGNNRGVLIAKTDSGAGAGDATENIIKNNKIGTNEDGSAAIPNIVSGISLTGGAFNNRIGGAVEFDGNLVSGNGDGDGTNGRGIIIYTALNTDGLTQESPHENKVLGNFVGINENHTAALPNTRSGIAIIESPGNIIGSNESQFARNVVGGNLLNGIAVTGSTAVGNRIDYNYVGVTPEGIAIGNNPDGINIDGAPQTIIGFNNICGNTGNGIAVSNLNGGNLKISAPNDEVQPSVTITGNRVGIFTSAANEVSKRPNGANGIFFNGVAKALTGVLGQIDVKNIVSGNALAGMLVTGDLSADNIINNTIVGTDENGTPNIGNGGAGIILNNSLRTILGDLDYRKRNSIAGNGGIGVQISGLLAANNKLHNNFIGVAPNGNGLRNDGDGVLISEGAKLNEVGGPGEGEGNIIANNGGSGVRINETAGHCNLVDPNAIFYNTGLGIDIGAVGRTPNDLHDADEGANRGQNYPELTSQINGADDLVVSYKVDSAPGDLSIPGTSNYGANGIYVEFFKADETGQGIQFLGFGYYTTADYNNGAPQFKQINLGNAAALGISADDKITATATDADNNTSEFFTPHAPTAARVNIAGQVRTASGRPIAGAVISITETGGTVRRIVTNTFGNYRLTEIEAGGTYVVEVSAKRYRFVKGARVVFAAEDITNLDFTASR